jgi:mono/diheme cytochrome c family protein
MDPTLMVGHTIHESQPASQRPFCAAMTRLFVILAAFGFARAAASAEVGADDFQSKVQPLVEEYCVKCHNPTKAKGGVNLGAFTNLVSVYREPEVWQKVLTKVQANEMPPEGKPQPSDTQRAALTHWVRQSLQDLEQGRFAADPGRVLIHRLSKTEYNCTIRDLLGVDGKPADNFPTEGGGGGGFDNNADTLFIPPILMERYLAAAGTLVEQAPRERIFFTKKGWFESERAAAKKIIAYFAMRGFRRPLEPGELDRLMLIYDRTKEKKRDFEAGVKAALTAILVSPNFLFRVETAQECNGAYRLSDYELASRLSYFLWSSMPDAELFHLAGANQLHQPKTLEQQVARMIRDPKSRVFSESFASQWLRVRELKTAAQPDPDRFPNYTPALREAMYWEVVDFFDSILREDASLLGLLSADYTFINSNLAKLYGISGVEGEQLRRVKLPDDKRGGLLGMAAVLTLTSYPQRTSPVLRGKWVLEEILGTPPPPPPPLVKSLPPNDAPVDGLTLRQQLEKHRAQPECAACHVRMDPLGFGLENFDPIGAWRTRIGTQPVDASGVLPDGEKFEGPAQLKKVLLDRREEFIRNLTRKMLAFALGRGLEYYDRPAVNRITKALASHDYRSSVLISQIVQSFPFEYRRNAPILQSANN